MATNEKWQSNNLSLCPKIVDHYILLNILMKSNLIKVIKTFDDKFFEQWLDNQAQRVMNLVGDGKAISPEEMMVLVLKAQTNHFAHLDIELREDMDRRFDLMREEMSKRFEQVDKRFEALTIRQASR